MSDAPISQLPEATTPISTDLMAIVVDNATIPVTKKITYSNLEASISSVPANSILSGLDADKSGTPNVGDIYYATDAKKLYLCSTVGVWEGFFMNSYPSETLRNSNDTERNINSLTYTKLKEIKLGFGLAKCRIKFDLRASTPYDVYAKIYKNGVAIGTERTPNSTTYQTFTEDFSDFAANDLIQLYARKTGDAVVYVRNFRLYYDYEPVFPAISTTNQD